MTFQKAVEMYNSDDDVVVAECTSKEMYDRFKELLPQTAEEALAYFRGNSDGVFYYYPDCKIYGHFSRSGLIKEGRNLIEFSTTPTEKLLKHVRGLQ